MKATRKHYPVWHDEHGKRHFNMRAGKLIAANNGVVVAYRELRPACQMAIAHYMAVDGEAWELPDDWKFTRNMAYHARKIASELPYFVENYGDEQYGYVEIPMQQLIEAVIADEELSHYGGDFTEYHKWYASQFLPKHQTKDWDKLWPVILSSFDTETLEDGWHRFHLYHSKGVKVVPAVWYPGTRHQSYLNEKDMISANT